MLTQQLNVDLSRAGITPSVGGVFGNLKLYGTGTPLDGLSVSQILSVANNALGGMALPSDLALGTLGGIVNELNNSFPSGAPTAWAQAHLSQ